MWWIWQDIDIAISDPVALQALFIKYREVYDVPEWFSEYVRPWLVHA